MDKLILFDIDQTLTRGRGHPDAFAHAFRSVYGVDAEQPEGTSGMTDRQIIMKAMLEKGLDRKEVIDKLEACMEEMTKYYESSIPDREIETCSGVPELLHGLRSREFMLGIISGNVEGIAEAKLKKAGVWHYFSIGGFGSERDERHELIRLAIKRAERLGFRPGNGVFVVGDTSRDIEAGKRAGVQTIGVATGPDSLENLRRAGADFLLEDLKDRKGFLEIVS
jgi:phosphoglycolate phosphatase